MDRIERFEDIRSWRKSRELTKQIYVITSQGNFKRDLGLRDQIRKASVSIVSNIAEGFERGAIRSFFNSWLLRKDLAGKSARSSISHLIRVSSARGLRSVVNPCNRNKWVLSGLMKYLKQSNLRGNKYH